MKRESSKSDLDFFDIPSRVPPNATNESEIDIDFFDTPSPKKSIKQETPSIGEQIKNTPLLLGREAVAGIHSFPSNVAELWRYVSNKLSEKGATQKLESGNIPSEEDEHINDFITNFIPDLVKKGGEKFPKILPTYQQARDIQTERLKKTNPELPEHGRGRIERGAEGIGRAAPQLLLPGSAAVKAASLATSGATEASDLSEGWKLAANLSVPALTSAIQAVAAGRYIPPAEAQQLYNGARQLGMSDAELAPVLATNAQIRRHGPLAAASAGTRTAFQQTEQALGNAIEGLQTRASASIPISANAETTLIQRLQGIINDVRSNTHTLSPTQQGYVDFITQTITDIQNGGSNSRQLIGTWRNVNDTRAGRTLLSRMKEPLLEAIESADPQLAQDLQTTNALYGRYINNLSEISPSAFNAFLNSGELQNVLGAVVSGSAPTLGKSIANVMSLGTLKKVSSLILTNPTAQSLVRNLGRSIRSGSEPAARAVGVQFQKYIRDNLPEEYSEIDWEELGLEP